MNFLLFRKLIKNISEIVSIRLLSTFLLVKIGNPFSNMIKNLFSE